MIKNILTTSILVCISTATFASAPVSTNPANGQPLPTTQQLMNQCENNTGAANCQQIVDQGEYRYQEQQQSLQDQINALPQSNSNIPDQPGSGSNPTMQPNY